MQILITGAAGMLGQDVQAAAAAAGHTPLALDRAALDITDHDAARDAVARLQPDVVINCAAFTDVDGAEAAPDAAHAVNADGAGHVAQAAARQGAWTIHVSSDYVFDGDKRTPYVESDTTRPLSVYGASKLAGEHEVRRGARGDCTVVRTSWLFGAGGRCFPDTMLRLAGQRDELRVVDDQIGCPTFTGHLARALVALAEPDGRLAGLVHLAAAGQCSWYEFARETLAETGATAAVKPVPTSDFPRPAPRPAYSVLRSERAERLPVLPDWREGLRDYLQTRVAVR